MRLRPLIVIPLCAAVVSCADRDGPTVHGTGPVSTENRTLPAFERLEVEDDFEVLATVGGGPAARITADENLLPYVRTAVRGGTLTIETTRRLRPRRRIRIVVSTPTLTAAETAGSSDVRVAGVRASGFEGSVGGSGSLVGEGDFGALTVHMSGSGRTMLSGEARTIGVEVVGSGDADLAGVSAREADVRVTGSGSVRLDASERVDAAVSGSGDVRYAGTPSVSRHVTGSGRVEPL